MKLNIFGCSACGENHKGIEVEKIQPVSIKGLTYGNMIICPTTKVQVLVSEDEFKSIKPKPDGLKMFIFTKEDEKGLPLTKLYEIMTTMDFVAEIEGKETRILKNRMETRNSIETENLWDYLRVLEEWRY